MKIQPVDFFEPPPPPIIGNDTVKSVPKSRFKKLFDRPFLLRISSSEKPSNVDSELEPSSVCLAKMVRNFMEESNEKPKSGRSSSQCANCFNPYNVGDSSDDEFDVFGSSAEPIHSVEAADFFKSLIFCTNVTERNLLADTAKIVDENNKIHMKSKDDLRKVVTDGLIDLGYNASICKSHWDKSKSPSYPAGEYEYIDATVGGERFLIDIDFRSEFEIARSTANYKAMLQSLPFIFVGKSDRLQQIVSIVSEAAKQSLTKKGMHCPPWRKSEYMRNKWISPYTIIAPLPLTVESGESVLSFGEEESPPSNSNSGRFSEAWRPPATKPKSCDRGARVVVTGLASLLTEEP